MIDKIWTGIMIALCLLPLVVVPALAVIAVVGVGCAFVLHLIFD